MNEKLQNLYGSIFLIIMVPSILFIVLIKINNISNIIYPNTTSLLMFFGLLIYGYILLKISNKTFTGPTNVNDVTPNYAHNGFKF
jgi:hypothetical protein